MKTFITCTKKEDGLYRVIDIHAQSWAEAQIIASQIGVEILGVL